MTLMDEKMAEKSGMRGVTWEEQKKGWKVRVRRKHIAFTRDLEEAKRIAVETRQAMGMPERTIAETMKKVSYQDLYRTTLHLSSIIAKLNEENERLKEQLNQLEY